MSSTIIEHAPRSADLRESAGAPLLPAEDVARAEQIARWFDQRYRDAQDRPEALPWWLGGAHPALIAWLNVEAPKLVRPGCRAVVAAAGLGDDAAELAHRGYDVLAFDRSPHAVRWASHRHPDLADRLLTADLLDLPSKLRRRFDLVVAVNALALAPPSLRDCFMGNLSALMHPRGAALVTIDRCCDDATTIDDNADPPYPVSAAELSRLAAARDLRLFRPPDDFEDDAAPPRRWLRAALRH